MRRCGEPNHRFLNDKSCHALGTRIWVGFGINNQSVGIRTVGDPVFVATQTVVIIAFFGAQLHRNHVRSCARFRHRQSTYVFARNQTRQVLCLLFSRAVQLDLIDAKVRVGTVGQRHRGRGPRDLFDSDSMG